MGFLNKRLWLLRQFEKDYKDSDQETDMEGNHMNRKKIKIIETSCNYFIFSLR